MGTLGIILGVISLIGALATAHYNSENVSETNQANRDITDKTNEASRQLSEQQHQWNVEDWQRRAEWESPQAQMQRFKAAGLNPSLIYGQMSESPSINSSTIPQLQSPVMQPFQMDNPLSLLSDHSLIASQIQNLEADTKQKSSLSGYYDAKIGEVKAMTSKLDTENSLLSNDLKASNAILQSKIDSELAKFVGDKAQAELSKAEAEENKKYVVDMAKAHYDAVRAEADRILALKGIADEQKQLVQKQVAQYEQLIIKLEKDNAWYTADKIIGYLTDIGGVALGFTRVGQLSRISRAASQLSQGKQAYRNMQGYDAVDLDGYNIPN